VGDTVCSSLSWGQVVRNMNWHLSQTKLQSSLIARVTDDDDAIFIDDNRLSETESLNGPCNSIYRAVVLSRVALVRLDRSNRTHFDQHVYGSFYIQKESEACHASREQNSCSLFTWLTA